MDTLFNSFVGLAGVVVALVTILFTSAQHRKDSKMTNIVKERKQWRDKLRCISDEIAICEDYSTLVQITNKLKTRINPNGRIAYGTQWDRKVSEDSYIWQKIIIIQEHSQPEETLSSGHKSVLEKDKQDLIELISISLKMDWERSKSEVLGSSDYFVYTIITFGVMFLTDIYLIFVIPTTYNFPTDYFKFDTLLYFLSISLLFLTSVRIDSLSQKNVYEVERNSVVNLLKQANPFMKGKVGGIVRILAGLNALNSLVVICGLVYSGYKLINDPQIPRLDTAVLFLLFLVPTLTWFFRIFPHLNEKIYRNEAYSKNISDILGAIDEK